MAIVARVLTQISINGPGERDGDTVVFLGAGQASCAGAAFAEALQGGVIHDGKLSVQLMTPGVYIICVAHVNHPTDADFSIASAQLIVHPAPPSPPPPPLPPPPPPRAAIAASAATTVAATAAIAALPTDASTTADVARPTITTRCSEPAGGAPSAL